MKKLMVTLKLTEQMLGTKPANADIFADYVASKHPKGTPARDELENAENVEDAGTTVFHRDRDGRPCIYDYQVKGFFKDACGGLRRCPGTASAALKAYKGVIDACVFAAPRLIALELDDGARLGVCERPLRCETMQGPRVALARSESAPEGTTLRFELTLLQDSLEGVVREWLEYGALRGLGQWRNSGCGRFTFTIDKV